MKIKWPPIIIILLSILAGIYYYPLLPEKVASHWNASGQVDGYMTQFWGTFLMPLIMLFLYLLLVIVPSFDPKKENIKKFEGYYNNFIFIIVLFFAYLYGLTIYWNLGHVFNFTIYLVPAFAVLFFYIGHMISKAEQNWTIGIRTPWTLSNKVVWDKTHKVGGNLFKLSAVISLLGFVWTNAAFLLVIGPVILTAIFIYIYSYILFRTELKK